MMAKAKLGDIVKVHYTGTLNDGTVFDSSKAGSPLEFTIGEGQVIPGFEQAVIGMEEEDSKTVKIIAEDAYGPHREELLLEIGKEQVPEGAELKIGMSVEMSDPSGNRFIVRITEITDTNIKLDANHPMAGKDLTFEIILEEIVKE